MDTQATASPSTSRATSRRALLSGGLGVAGAAFLAACGSDSTSGRGLSGAAMTTTTVAPTVPTTEPSEASLALDVTVLRTGDSLEVLAAQNLKKYGPKLSDAELRAAAERMAADHEANAKVFAASVPDKYETGAPNEFLQVNFIDPLVGTLTNDAAILNLFTVIERTLTATYITAVGTFTTAKWRQQVMEFGAASARRAAVFANSGAGGTVGVPLFPLSDLIPNKAYLSPENEAAATTTTEG